MIVAYVSQAFYIGKKIHDKEVPIQCDKTFDFKKCKETNAYVIITDKYNNANTGKVLEDCF